MDFKSRFKGKCSVMNKEGVIGIVKQPSNPIAKQSQKGFVTDYDSDYSPIQRNVKVAEVPIDSKSQVFTNIQHNRNSHQGVVYSQKFQNYAQQMLADQQSLPQQKEKNYNPQKYLNNKAVPIKYEGDFKNLDLNEYQIVAIPRNALNYNEVGSKEYQQMMYPHMKGGFDKYSMTHSFAPQPKYENNKYGYEENNYRSPLIKTYSYNPEQQQVWQSMNKGMVKDSRESNGSKTTKNTSTSSKSVMKPPLMKNQSERFAERQNKLMQAGLGSIRYNSYQKK